MADEQRECPICTTEVDETMERCPLCGELLDFNEKITCPTCSAKQKYGSKTCSKCGEILKKKTFECPVCSSEMEEGSKECGTCGEILIVKEKKTFECPTCSVDLEEGILECHMCGESFVESKGIECPVCSSEVEEDAMECPTCGEPLGYESSGMMVCPACSNEVGEDAYDCPICGEILVVEEGEPCPYCSEMVEEDSERCSSCGNWLIEELVKEVVEEPVPAVVKKSTVIKDDELIDDFVDMEECIEDEVHGDVVMIPKALSAFFTFMIPLFLVIFVGMELFISMSAFPRLYPSNALLRLTLFSYLTQYWLIALVASFVVALLLFLMIMLSYDFQGKKGAVTLDRNGLMVSLILTLFMLISLGYYVFTTVFYPAQITSYILFFFLGIASAAQVDLLRRVPVEAELITPVTVKKEPVVVKKTKEPVKVVEKDDKEEMEQALDSVKGLVKEVREIGVGVDTVRALMASALESKREGDSEEVLSLVEDIKYHHKELMEINETMELCEDKIRETLEDGMDAEPYIHKLELAKEQADVELYRDAKDTLSFLLVEVIHESPEPKVCPVCSQEVSEEDTKCPDCGEPLTEEAKDVLDSLHDLLEELD